MQDFSCTDLRATVRVFTGSSLAPFPPCYGLSLRTRIWLCPSSWKTRPSTGFFLFPVVAIGGTIGLPPPLFLVLIPSSPVWPRITLDKVSESWKRSVSLSHLQVSSLEPMLSSVCEVTSWLNWWLSTCRGFREHLTDEAHGNFERLMLSGSRAVEFLGNQGITALGSLVSSHQDSLLLDAWSMHPAEEVARLCYADFPSSSGIFPHYLA